MSETVKSAISKAAFVSYGRNVDACEICGTNEHLDIHHINKNRDDISKENLVLLCRKCHKRADAWGLDSAKRANAVEATSGISLTKPTSPNSKLIRVDLECEEILRKYSSGSINDCIRAMEAVITKGTVNNAININEDKIVAAIDKRISAMMEKYERGQKAVNEEILSRLPTIEGYPVKVRGLNGAPTSEFKRACSVVKGKVE